MIQVFEKTVGKCKVCKTPVSGKNKIGDDLYCDEDYEKEQEKPANKLIKLKAKRFKKMFRN